MAKSTRYAPRISPDWPDYSQSPPSISNPGTLDAVGEKIIVAGSVMWADGGTHDLSAVRWRSSSAGGLTGTLQVSLRDVDETAGPPLRDDGVADQSVDHTNPGGNSNFTSTFGAARANVATGDQLCVVFEVTARTAGSMSPGMFGGITQNRRARPQVVSYLGAVYTATSETAALTLVASDGTVGIFSDALPAPNAAITAQAYNVDTAGADEYALAFSPTEPHWIGRGEIRVSPAAGASYETVLYAGTTARVTRARDANTWHTDAQWQEDVAAFPDEAVTSGTTYYLAVKPTTTSSVTIYLWNVASGDLEAFAKGYGLASRVDGGAWSAVSATQIPMGFSLGFVASDDGVGGGGGGMIVHPGMAGGMRG